MSYPTQQTQYPEGSAPPPIGFSAQPPPYAAQPMGAYPPPQGPPLHAGGKVAPMMPPQQFSQTPVMYPQQVQYVQPTVVHVTQPPQQRSTDDDDLCCLACCVALWCWCW
ncbi:hypothetical protein Bbelb_016990 [Branchiostoma belcheri]|nr:hypothetical protein Bbelb_016990 [Branchiostoma belcheri]